MATRRIETAEISTSKENPTVVPTWELWKDKSKIYAKAHSKAEGKDFYTFPNQEGEVFLCNTAFNKYAYFRNPKFQEFLNKHGLTAVKRLDPNRDYRAEACHHGGGEASWSIWTDGAVEHLSIDTGRTDNWREDRRVSDLLYEEQRIVSVSGATYVILEQITDVGDRKGHARVLYTLEDVFELKIA